MESMRVNFMIIGAMKCATTSFAVALDTHPRVSFSRPKEPHFFSKSSDWRSQLADYHAKFPKKGDCIYGEGSTSYTKAPYFRPGICDDLYEYNDQLKLIYIVRNPLDEIVSHYMHSYERGYANCALSDAFVEKPIFVDTARYWTQIEPYIKRFGSEQILILNFEEVTKSSYQAMAKALRFLELEDAPEVYETVGKKHANVSLSGRKKHHKYDRPNRCLKLVRKLCPPLWEAITDNRSRLFTTKPVLSQEQKDYLRDILNPELEALETYTGFSLEHWRI